jgi:uncharacterized protein
MPIEVNIPGVYEQLSSGQHTIAPVGTSIAAFVGRAPFGPTDRPSAVFSFGDFVSQYGGLQFDYPLSYAVQDFFANGGSQAIIARLFEPNDGDGVAKLKLPGQSPQLILCAANPGEWGNGLSAQVDTRGISDVTSKLLGEYDLTTIDLFNLTLTLTNARGQTLKSERFVNVAVKQTGNAAHYPNRLDQVLASQSNLARVAALSPVPPADGATAVCVGGNNGAYLEPGTYIGDPDEKTGMYMLEHVEAFNLLCIPPDRRILPAVPDADQDLPIPVRRAAAHYCADRRAFFIVDPPVDWINKAKQGQLSAIDPASVGISGINASGIEVARNAAVYFPRVIKPDLMSEAQPAIFPPCGIVAGIMAATDVRRGVWKAPAGTDAGLAGVSGLELNLTDNENGVLNQLGINCLRNFPIIGPVVWGTRTMQGADWLCDDYKYVPVRRLALFIEDSLLQGTKWAVFEPNDEALWSSLRLMASSFLASLSQQGALYNYSVACDATTTTPTDIALGKVNILVQIAPVHPAEFVVIQIQQTAGSTPS